MSKLTEKLGSVGIYNEWDFAGHGNVFISYTPADNGRGGRGAYWSVVRPGFNTNPDAHWRDRGCKTFTLFGSGGRSHAERKQAVFEQVKQWASERYGIKEWARTPFGSWMDAEFVAKRLKELEEQAKENR